MNVEELIAKLQELVRQQPTMAKAEMCVKGAETKLLQEIKVSTRGSYAVYLVVNN